MANDDVIAALTQQVKALVAQVKLINENFDRMLQGSNVEEVTRGRGSGQARKSQAVRRRQR